jgi:uncharacterized membrane protein
MRERLAAVAAQHGLALAILILGLGYATLTAPFGVPDEFAHFWRACHVSEGHILAQTRPGEGRGAMLPRSVDAAVETLVHYHSVPLPSPRIDWKAWESAWRMGFHSEDRMFRSFSSTANYSPLPYLPAAAAIALARECHLSVLAGIYLARFANALAVAALLGLAWRRLPCARESFALTAMLPMTLSLIGSLSIDAVSFAFAFLWIALVLKFNCAEKRPDGSRRNQIELIIVAALLGQTKFSFPLALLALLCFFGRGSPHRQIVLTSLAALAVALVSGTLWVVASGLLTTATRPDVANPALQMAFIREHPERFAAVCAYTFRISVVEYGRQIVGVLGWLQIRLPEWLYAGMWVVLGLSTGFQGLKERENFTPAARVFCGGLAATILLCVYVALYEMWNPVGAPVIDGVQGRYFILMLPLLSLACGHSLWLRLHAAGPIRTGVYAFALVANGCALFTQFRAAFG